MIFLCGGVLPIGFAEGSSKSVTIFLKSCESEDLAKPVTIWTARLTSSS